MFAHLDALGFGSGAASDGDIDMLASLQSGSGSLRSDDGKRLGLSSGGHQLQGLSAPDDDDVFRLGRSREERERVRRQDAAARVEVRLISVVILSQVVRGLHLAHRLCSYAQEAEMERERNERLESKFGRSDFGASAGSAAGGDGGSGADRGRVSQAAFGVYRTAFGSRGGGGSGGSCSGDQKRSGRDRQPSSQQQRSQSHDQHGKACHTCGSTSHLRRECPYASKSAGGVAR